MAFASGLEESSGPGAGPEPAPRMLDVRMAVLAAPREEAITVADAGEPKKRARKTAARKPRKKSG